MHHSSHHPRRALPSGDSRAASRPGHRILSLALASTMCVALTFAIPSSISAAAQGIQNVSVQVGSDGSITDLSSSTAVQHSSTGLTGTTTQLDPQSDAAQLPVRVTTVWWMDGRTGTNLASLKGATGRVTIEVNIENLTLKPQEVSIEDQGARYRQYALVGVPLTVTAAANLGQDMLGSVVTAGDDSASATNGAASQTTTGDAVVQWAALLAPPFLPSMTTFRLVLDASGFTVPDFDITVQPGLTTDPSFEQVLSTASGADSSESTREEATLEAVMNVAAQLKQGQDLIEQVYDAISQDASQLGVQTYSQLQTSSDSILSQIDSTKDRLTQLSEQTQSQTTAIQSDMATDLSNLLTSLNTDVLGATDGDLELTGTPVTGCTIALPELAEDTPRTLASAVRLVKAQLGTVIQTFADPTKLGADDSQGSADSKDSANTDTDTGGTATVQNTPDSAGTADTTNTLGTPGESGTPEKPSVPDEPAPPVHNCRSTLLENLAARMGTADTDCSADGSSVRCVLKSAKAMVASNFGHLTGLRTDLTTQVDDLGIPELASQIQLLARDMDTLKTAVSGLTTDLSNGAASSSALVTPLMSALPEMQARVDTIRSMVESIVGEPETTPSANETANTTVSLSSLKQSVIGLANDAAALGQKVALHDEQALAFQTDIDAAFTSIGEDADAISSALGSAGKHETGLYAQVSGAEKSWTDISASVPASSQAKLPDTWRTDIAAILTQAKVDDSHCPAVWNKKLGATGSVSAYTSALTAVAVAKQCPAAPTAGLLASLLGAYTERDAASSAATDSPDFPAMRASLDDISAELTDMATHSDIPDPKYDDSLSDISADLGTMSSLMTAATDTLDQLTTQLEDAVPDLEDLWQSTEGEDPTGFLADAAEALQQIQDLTATGDLSQAESVSTGLLAQIEATYPGAVTPGERCQNFDPEPASPPQGSVDSVIWLSNLLTCQKDALTSSIDTWWNAVTDVYAQAGTTLDTAITRNDDALDLATQDVTDLSDSLVSELKTKTATITDENLAAIDDVKDRNQQELDQLAQSFTDSTDTIVSNLAEQVTAANLDADNARAILEQDFASVLANLGMPDQSSRVGLLGELHRITAMTGDTVAMLETVKQTATSQESVLSTQLLDLRLQAAQFQAAQDRVSDLSNFPGAPSGVDAFTVFSVHVSGS